jgi:hypothetical protein
MLRPMSLLTTFLLLGILAIPASAQDPAPQDQPPSSLGDIARQARKDKEKNASRPKAVITDDSFSPSKSAGGLGLSDIGSSESAGTGDKLASAMAKVDEAEAALKKLDSFDRATLAKAVLMDNDVDFPNRRVWEDKLYAAKGQYVSHEHDLIVELRQIVGQVQLMQASQGGGKLDPKAPGVAQLKSRLSDIIQEAVRTEQDYRAVVTEGWDLAKLAKH